MSDGDFWLGGDAPILVRATFVKETKTTYRYDVEANDHGVSGCLYVKQPGGRFRPPKTLKIKVKPDNAN